MKTPLSLFTFLALLTSPQLFASIKLDTRPEVTNPTLENFSFDASPLSDAETAEVEAAEASEASYMKKALQTGQGEIFQRLSPLGLLGKYVQTLGRSERLYIQYFLKAPSVGKQFVMISLDGELKHVFAISGGADWTPTSSFTRPFGVNGMSKHAESGKFPGRDPNYGYGNMDYFINFYGQGIAGFHATLKGAYSKLGNGASHGCIRQARGEAQAHFQLVEANDSAATIVGHEKGIDPKGVDIEAVKFYLKRDLDHIQGLIRKGQYGSADDLPDQPRNIRVEIPNKVSLSSPN